MIDQPGEMQQATEAAPDRIEPWLKLAAMCRADDDLATAPTVSGAPRIDPPG